MILPPNKSPEPTAAPLSGLARILLFIRLWLISYPLGEVRTHYEQLALQITL